MNPLGSLVLCGALSMLSGCVSAGAYNSMLQQQQQIESALRAEIAADQVEIQELKNGIRVRMADGLLYESGSTQLSQRGQAALDKVAPQLAQSSMQSFQVDVVGNTDNVPIGPDLAERYPSNWDLGAARATAVVRHLQAKGVDPRSMVAVSNGQYHPIAPNDSPADRARNRRTDVLLRPE